MPPTQARTSGAHHIGLTVLDIDAASQFFTDALGFAEVGKKPDYPAVFVSDGSIMITLWQATDPTKAVAFDRHHNLGMHHLALQIIDAEALDSLSTELETRNDTHIEFLPEALGNGPRRHMMCRIPGGIRLELISA